MRARARAWLLHACGRARACLRWFVDDDGQARALRRTSTRSFITILTTIRNKNECARMCLCVCGAARRGRSPFCTTPSAAQPVHLTTTPTTRPTTPSSHHHSAKFRARARAVKLVSTQQHALLPASDMAHIVVYVRTVYTLLCVFVL